MIGILINPETGDLLINRGGLVPGETTAQVAEFVLRANRGEFKEMPLIGAEVIKLNNGIQDPMWCGNTRKMLNACGVPVSRVRITEGNTITLE